jgi:hypothetical protein
VSYITDSFRPVAFGYLRGGPGHPCRARRYADFTGTVEGTEEVAIAVTIGASVALIVIGAILRFGVTWQPAHVDLQVIGVILMVAGVLGLALSLLFMLLRRNDRRSAQVYEERRYTDPPA